MTEQTPQTETPEAESQAFTQLKNKLKEMFQIGEDQDDYLDFGIYRIMNQKHKEISNFLNSELLPQVRGILQGYHEGNRTATQEELQRLLNGLITETDSVKVSELQEQAKYLKAEIAAAVDFEQVESEVYSSLYNFFNRYYSEGDFMSLRRYKDNAYALPYNGEEVKLHWANHDQYYIKTSETLKNYSFKTLHGKRVCFEVVAGGTEQNNNKAANGKERRFVLCTDQPTIATEDELTVRFEYRPLRDDEKTKTTLNAKTGEEKTSAKKQEDLNNEAIVSLLSMGEASSFGLGKKCPTPKNKERTVLEKHLTNYTAKNTFDYFIHKDLAGFLKRELDFYIKNEIMHLDDIENQTVQNIEAYLNKVKALRGVASKIIAFLAQLEDFQKKLWLKKKFVLETHYCVTLDKIINSEAADELLRTIADNKQQREEWVKLFAINEINGDLANAAAYSESLSVDFLKAHDKLPVDTKFFDADFKFRLLAIFDNLDKQTDGVLINSENFQALNLLQARYQEQVKCVYIDPPYNTEGDGFAYKDSYRHSSWLSMMENRLVEAVNALNENGVVFISVDDKEQANLKKLCVDIFGAENFIACLPTVMNLKGNNDEFGFAGTHEYTLVFAKNKGTARFNEFTLNGDDSDEWEEDELGFYKKGANLKSTGGNAPREKRPNLFFPIFVDSLDNVYVTDDDTPPSKYEGELTEILPMTDGAEMSWRWSKGKIKNEKGDIIITRNGGVELFKKQRPDLGDLPSKKPKTIFYKPSYSSGNGTAQIKQLLNARAFNNPKPLNLLKDLVEIGLDTNSFVLDYFAGSGTTGHAVINLNREDGGSRKYILVEMGTYFDSVTLPRVLKAAYSADWKEGKPVSRDGVSQLIKYIALEQYEDTMDSLELKQPKGQPTTLAAHPNFKEGYMLGYLLDTESQDSDSLLNINKLANPFDYKLSVTRNDEPHDKEVDLVETFNYLLGLTVRTIARNDLGMVVVNGVNRNGEKCLILWRSVAAVNNDLLNKWFVDNCAHYEFDVVYVNGDNTLASLKADNDKWQVCCIDVEFKQLMFNVQDI